MKMHEYQNKRVTKKAFRKCKKRKECGNGCLGIGKYLVEQFCVKLRVISHTEE